MCGTAAHLVDHVLRADVPVRQWVLTAPHEVRRVLALRPDALTAAARGTSGEAGAVTFVQRFNGLLGCRWADGDAWPGRMRMGP